VVFAWFGNGNYYCFFPSAWKVANYKGAFDIICVRDSRILLGRNLRVVLVMRSLPGLSFCGGCL